MLGLPDSMIRSRPDTTTVLRCGDSSVAEKWIDGHIAVDEKLRERIGEVQKTRHSWWKRKLASLPGKDWG